MELRKLWALLIVGWVLAGMSNTDGLIPLREYASQLRCAEVAEAYNVEHVWDGPQEVLTRLEGELFCTPDHTEQGVFPLGVWHTEEWRER